MKQKNSDDRLGNLLDEIASRLGNEPCPPMPQAIHDGLTTTHPAPVETKRSIKPGHLWSLAAAGSLLIACLVFGYVRLRPVVVEENRKSPLSGQAPQVVIQNLDSLKPYASLENELAAMKTEVTQLKKEAALLDALHKADSLIAQTR